MTTRTRFVKRLGMEITVRTKVQVEIVMSDDWAECVAHQAEELLNLHKDTLDEDGQKSPRQELRDLVDAINEGLR